MIAYTLYIVVPISVVAILIYIRYPLFKPDIEPLPFYAMAYHAYLVGQYREVKRAQSTAPEKEIEQIANETEPENLRWHDLFQLELWTQNKMTLEELQRKGWLLRRRYEIISGKATHQAYENSKPPDLSDQKTALATLKADLGVLLQDLYWMYQIRTAWGKGRDSISRTIGWFLMVTTLALGTIAVARAVDCAPPGGKGLLLIDEAVMMGATGGLVSLWRRLQITPRADRRLDGVLEFEHGRLTIMFQSFISGSIFAFILLLIFASGLADGTLFPSLKVDNTSFLGMLEHAATDGVIVAKLLVWSFVAGFAERFVPDFLDRLTTAANQTKEDGSQPAPATPSAPATT